MGDDGSGSGGGGGAAEPLLKRARYHPNCPGCSVDRRKEEREGFPFTELSCLWLVTICSSLPIQSLFPFLYFMIRDLHVAKEEEDIGFYAGFVGASYMLGRALTSVIWGVVADKYGRKPVLVITLFSVIIFNTLFGLSSSYWMALTTRGLLGLLSGMLGPVKMTWYVVFKGRVPGVYEHWEDAHRQVNGFKGNLYKGYPTRSIAEGHWRRRNRGRMGTDAGYLVILPALIALTCYILYVMLV